MQDYEHILVAVGALDKSEAIVSRAHAIAKALNSKLSLMQALEDIAVTIPSHLVPPEGVDKIAWFKDMSTEQLVELCNRLGIDDPDIHVMIGSAKEEIVDYAKQLHADLLVVGSHERHGLAQVFQTVTDGVVHHACCDVLAVHMDN